MRDSTCGKWDTKEARICCFDALLFLLLANLFETHFDLTDYCDAAG